MKISLSPTRAISATAGTAIAYDSLMPLPTQISVQMPPPSMNYDDWFESVFRVRVPVPVARIACSWTEDTPWGHKAHNALLSVELEYVHTLLQEIKEKNIEGEIVEFGIFQGWWINFFWQETERMGLQRRIYGFDSFEGLSEPDPKRDGTYWKRGQYACGWEQVSKNVQARQRPRIRLVRGFFEKSLLGPDAQLVEKFSYVRIDSDLYEPARDCLNYLSNRLADGAILVFDDWPHLLGYGEQLAFEEWLVRVPHLEFEFLFYNTIGHFYLRVHHKK